MIEHVRPHEMIALSLMSQGKVRDIFFLESAPDRLLVVTSDRISAYDWVMPDGIPGKGVILNRMSAFWFGMMSDIIANHMISIDPREYPKECEPYLQYLAGRTMLVQKAMPLPVECIMRGNITGSFWSDFKKADVLKNGKSSSLHDARKIIHGLALPADMQESEEFLRPLFTPSTKASVGAHDENVSFDQMIEIMREWLPHNGFIIDPAVLCMNVRRASEDIYIRARKYAKKRRIIIADTKFEFGLLPSGKLIFIDEALTPDSSRFWPADQIVLGKTPPSFDKQFLRDWLVAQGWDKKSPPPHLSQEVIEMTSQKYQEAYNRLVLQG
ncbi:MAG: phosphoribosylaminoimidazolesuccinocarboxamide synthase [Parcubacteria group bacterium]|jgi:phosphoribosylaminoimidazole-succinocarboxamide synthase